MASCGAITLQHLVQGVWIGTKQLPSGGVRSGAGSGWHAEPGTYIRDVQSNQIFAYRRLGCARQSLLRKYGVEALFFLSLGACMKRKYAIAGVVIAVVVAAAVFYSTPYIALYSIHRAVERNDAEAVSGFVDFPVLRENIREKVMDHMAGATGQQSGTGALGGIGQILATAAANQMVDALVSPEGVMMLMEGAGSLKQMPQLQQLPQRPQGDGVKSVDAEQLRNRARDVRVTYQGWSKVRVGVPREPGALVFRRDGLWGWRLIAAELPEAGRV